MQHVWKDPNFGLASPDEDGRKVALAFMKQLREALADFAQWRASQDVKFIEIHSAPTRMRQPRRHGRLARGPRAAGLVRCQAGDRALRQVRRGQKPEKGFLPIEDEIALCGSAGIGLTVNWGRSVVEGRTPETAVAHVEAAAKAGVLSGLMFSGAGPEETQYGYG